MRSIQIEKMSPWQRVERTVKVTPEGCWNCLGGVGSHGYRSIGYKGKDLLAHRVSYEFFFGDIPPDLQVLHKCDNRLCVNPDHLFLGTQKDNMVDCSNKGRAKNGNSKLSENDVRALRKCVSDGTTQRATAKIFGLSQATVSEIVRGRVWRFIQ